MKTLIQHLWRTHQAEIIQKSIMHCHVRGLHSIMLLDSPEKLIRLFVADAGNEMYFNKRDNFTKMPMSIGFHPHHCDLTLYCIKGDFINWTVTDNIKENDITKFPAKKYLYTSKIKDENGGFKKIEDCFLKTIKTTMILEQDSVFLPANTIHTISCEPNKVTAWLVFEGKEDPNYKPYCWSNTDLENINLSDLYQKPTVYDIQRLLNLVGLF